LEELPPPLFPPLGLTFDFELDVEGRVLLPVEVVAVTNPNAQANIVEERNKENVHVSRPFRLLAGSGAKAFGGATLCGSEAEVIVDLAQKSRPEACKLAAYVNCADGTALDLPIRHDEFTTTRVEDAAHVAILMSACHVRIPDNDFMCSFAASAKSVGKDLISVATTLIADSHRYYE
jgi:hypothetical protein